MLCISKYTIYAVYGTNAYYTISFRIQMQFGSLALLLLHQHTEFYGRIQYSNR